MARAVRAAADERTPLVASAETKRTARRATTATLTAMGALAVGAMATLSEWSPAATRPSTASDALGMRAEEAFSGETAPTRTFTVDASCPSAKVRRKGGGFWSEPLTSRKRGWCITIITARISSRADEGWRCRRWLGTREGSPRRRTR